MNLTRRVMPAILGGALLLLGGAGLMAAAQPRTDLAPEKQALEDFARLHRLQTPLRDKAGDRGPGVQVGTAGDTWIPDTGMLGAINAPMPGSAFTTVNAWAGWLDPDSFVIVHAGGPAGDTGTGSLFVERIEGANGRIGSAASAVRTVVRVPAANGHLRILRVEDGVVIVANPAGRELRFRPLTAAFE